MGQGARLRRRRRTRYDHAPPDPDIVQADEDKARRRGHPSRRHSVEATFQIGSIGQHLLGSALQDLNPIQSQLSPHRGQKRDSLSPGLEEGHADIRIEKVEGKPRDAGPRADVEEPKGSRWELRQEEQGVEEESAHDLTWLLVAREIVHPIPLEQEGQVSREALPVLGSRGASRKDGNRGEELGDRIRGGPFAGHAFFVARAGTLAGLAPRSM